MTSSARARPPDSCSPWRPRPRSACRACSRAGCSTPAGAPARRWPCGSPSRRRSCWCRVRWRSAGAGTWSATTRASSWSTASRPSPGAQLCYFYAVSYLQVSVALLLEYTAPVAVVVWLWLRHGHRPSVLTVLGAAIAAGGLVLVLDVVSGAELSTVGVLWALGAMVGAATYFVISADEDNGLPGITPRGRRPAGRRRGAPGRARERPAAVRRLDRRRRLRRPRGGVVGPGAGARPGHRRVRLRHGHRGRAPAREPARVLRRAGRGAGVRRLRLGRCSASCPDRSSWPAACWCSPAWSWSSWARAVRRSWSSPAEDGRARPERTVSGRPAA